jgi:hypothetical protein
MSKTMVLNILRTTSTTQAIMKAAKILITTIKMSQSQMIKIATIRIKMMIHRTLKGEVDL